MPAVNEHHVRLRDPGEFDASTFRRVADGTLYGRIKVPQTIDVVWGKLKTANKPSDYPIAQALRFPVSDWTEAKAKQWLKSNKIKHIRFDVASKSKGEAMRIVSLVCDAGGITIDAASKDADGNESNLPTFSMVAYTGCAMDLTGWRHPVVIDLNGLALPAASQQIPVRLNHDRTRTVGHIESVSRENGVLKANGVFSFSGESDADRIVRAARQGFQWRASVGATVQAQTFIADGKEVVVNGRKHMGPLSLISRARLSEISFVDLGADNSATTCVAAQESEKEMNVMEKVAEDIVEDKRGNGTAEQDMEERENEIRAEAVKAERERLAQIEATCSGLDELDGIAELKAKAINGEYTIEALQAEILRRIRQNRAEGPAISTGSGPATPQVMEAAICRQAKLSSLEKAYDARVLEQADHDYGQGIGLQELLLNAAQKHGYTGRMRIGRNNIRDVLQAAFSTADVSGILSNIANKFVLTGFMSVEDVWKRISVSRVVSDFKTNTGYRLTGITQYDEVGPGGELKHGTLGEESRTIKANTYGRMIGISRTHIIDDDLGIFNQVQQRLGRGAALALNSVFWTEFMDNATFFTEAQGNYADGAATALSLDSLSAAEVLFMKQTDADKKPLGLRPALLLVPPGLGATAKQLYKSTEMRDTTADTKFLVANPHVGMYEPVVTMYLTDSALAWYLLANPADLPVMEVVFVDGQETPIIESAKADFNMLGIQIRGYLDFGVAKAEYRAGVKMKGEA